MITTTTPTREVAVVQREVGTIDQYGAVPVAPVPQAGAPRTQLAKVAPAESATSATDTLRLTAYYFPNSLDASNMAALEAQIKTLSSAKVRKVFISGFTDTVGPAELNMRLSRERVNRITGYFMRAGVNPFSIYKQFFGDQYSSAGKVEQERRLDILVTLEK